MKRHPRAVKNKIVESFKKDPGKFMLKLVIALTVIIFFIAKRTFFTPDTLFVAMLAIAVLFGQARQFIFKFLPFAGLLLIYDSFRGIADDLNNNVHYMEMVYFDEWLFGGTLPTVTLQQWWFDGALKWYDFYFYFIYMLHFVVPFLAAALIWKAKPTLYWPYVGAFVGLSFAAFFTFLLYPAAPPWLASDKGLIEPIAHMSSNIWIAMGVTNFSEVYNNLSPNLVAAVPSLHSAYPLLVVMYLAKVFSWRRAWWTLVYPFSVWLGVVYLGEHYVIDVILGVLYAVAAYLLTELVILHYRNKRKVAV